MSANNARTEKATAVAVTRTAATIGIAVNSTIIYVLNDIKSEDCVCTNDWRHVFCYYYSLVLIGLNSALLVLGSNQRLKKIIPFINLLNLFNVMSLVSYLHKLSSNQCNCEYTHVQKLIRYTYTVIAFFYIVAVIYMIFFALAMMSLK